MPCCYNQSLVNFLALLSLVMRVGCGSGVVHGYVHGVGTQWWEQQNELNTSPCSIHSICLALLQTALAADAEKSLTNQNRFPPLILLPPVQPYRLSLRVTPPRPCKRKLRRSFISQATPPLSKPHRSSVVADCSAVSLSGRQNTAA